MLGAIAVGPLVSDRPRSHQSWVMQSCHAIGLAMFAYANDNDGKYPTGNSSTEVFQKLVDSGYISDPSLLFAPGLGIPGKTKATSNRLKPENVCWDVTVPVDANSSDGALPLVFSTGYRIEYAPSGRAIPLANTQSSYLIAYFVSNFATYLPTNSTAWTNGVIPNVLPATFNAKGVKYVQLTPDGPLP